MPAHLHQTILAAPCQSIKVARSTSSERFAPSHKTLHGVSSCTSLGTVPQQPQRRIFANAGPGLARNAATGVAGSTGTQHQATKPRCYYSVVPLAEEANGGSRCGGLNACSMSCTMRSPMLMCGATSRGWPLIMASQSPFMTMFYFRYHGRCAVVA